MKLLCIQNAFKLGLTNELLHSYNKLDGCLGLRPTDIKVYP